MNRRALAVAFCAVAVLGCNEILGIRELPDDDSGSPTDGSVDVITAADASDAADAPAPFDAAGDAADAAVDAGCTDDPDAAPPLGTQALQPNSDSNGSGMEAFRMTASRDTCISVAALYVPLASPAILIGLYDDVSGPHTLLAQGRIDSPVIGWNTASLDKVLGVSTGEVVWFAIMATKATDTARYLDTANGATTFDGQWVADSSGNTSFPSIFLIASVHADGPVSAYLE